ncbi:MAG: hypothetical protein M1823_003085 [Watsoniomyces obsoletus]|nr:MAG: hypothetical protein M1823_003085 [Watsoniomyces obsoletus]
MRLRLSIQRHGLPNTQILWTIAGSGDKSISIAELLEQVNNIIPLEAEDWGLEDYAVECAGYECLHFQPVGTVLKDLDQVDIRPYSSKELRLRRLSGRLQISSDGRHLVDGLAFGQPYVGRPIVRPPVRIPPRKRRRLTYADDDDDDDATPQFAPQDDTAGLFITETGHGSSDDEKDSNHEPGNGDATMENGRDSPGVEGNGDDDSVAARAEAAEELEELAPPMLLEEDKSNHGQLSTLANGIQLSSPHLSPSPIQRSGRKSRMKMIMPRRSSSQGSRRSSFRSSDAGGKAVRFEEPKAADGIDESSAESGDDSDDDPDDDDFQPDDEEDEVSVEDEDEDNEDGSSSSDASSSSSSGAASSSSDESQGPPAPLRSNSTKAPAEPGPPTDANGSEQPKSSDRPTVPPGKGLVGTKKRNERRRRHNILLRKKRDGILPPHATWEDYEKLQRGEPLQDFSRERSTVNGRKKRAEDDRAEMEAKKQELLATISSGGGDATTKNQRVRGEKQAKAAATEPARRKAPTGEITDLQQADPVSMSVKDGQTQQPPDELSPRPRPRLDMASSKRMLLSSLGLGRSQLAKTKQGPESTEKNKNTAKDSDGTPRVVEASQPMNQSTVAAARSDPVQAEASAEADDSWKNKIILDAVECCAEGVSLSTPPFPFIQRWDPQQKTQYGNWGNKKRKRRQPRYYEEDEQYHRNGDDWGGFEEIGEYANGDEVVEDAAEQTLKNQDPAASNGTHIDNTVKAVREGAVEPSTVAEEEDDIPAMPADVNTCQTLGPKDLIPGAIIGFKQLVIANNWQPEVTAYRTARVERMLDGNVIEFTLAKRDRPQTEKIYDENGKRVYGGFEAPGDDDDEDVDNGSLQLGVSELIEPKLVQAGPAPLLDSGMPTAVEPEVEEEEVEQRSSEEYPIPRSAIDQVTDRDLNELSGIVEGASGAGEELAAPNDRDDLTEVGSRSDQINSHQDYPEILDHSVTPARDFGSAAMMLETPASPAFRGLDLEPRRSMHDSSPEVPITTYDSPEVNSPDHFRPDDDDGEDDPLFVSYPDSLGLPSLNDTHSSQSPRGVAALLPDPVPTKEMKTSTDAPVPVQADHTAAVLNITQSSIRKNPHANLSEPPPPPPDRRAISSSPRKHGTDEDCSSECGLPSLDAVFSSFRPSLASIKDEYRSSQVMATHKVENIFPSKAVKPEGQHVTALKKVKDNGTTSKGLLVTSMQKKSNDVVDLTQLSDGLFGPIELDDDEEEEEVSELPSGPGWVDKVRPGRGRAKAGGTGRAKVSGGIPKLSVAQRGGLAVRQRGKGGRGRAKKAL